MRFVNLLAQILGFGFTPVRYFASPASQQGHWYELFKANVQHILGEHPAHSILSHLGRPESGGGEGVWLNSIDAAASDDATSGPSEDLATAKKFSQGTDVTQDFAGYLTTLTPFNDVVKWKTYSEPVINEWGHSFHASEDTWQNLTDPKSTVISVGMQKMHRQRDIQFAQAVIAPSVNRRQDGGAIGAVNLPASQEIAGLTYATANVDSLAAVVREIMGNAWFTIGMPLYCCVSTTLARHLKANGDAGGNSVLRSTDFVSSYEHFKMGSLPNIEGITFIEMPKEFMDAVKPPSGTVDHFFAWSPQAICNVQYQGLGTQIGIDPNRRFYTAAYVSEYIDFKRTDDLGVVWGDIT